MATDPKGENRISDSMVQEARELGKISGRAARIEAITHDSETATPALRGRTRNFVVARKGKYSVAVSTDTAKADMYPPTDFTTWAKDERARNNWPVYFRPADRQN